MAVLLGRAGKVMVASATVAEIDEWTVQTTPEIKDVFAFGDTTKRKQPTILEWSGTFKGKFDNTDTNGQLALITAGLAMSSVAIKLYVDGTHYWSGTAYLGLAQDAKADDFVNASYTLTGSGALTYT